MSMSFTATSFLDTSLLAPIEIGTSGASCKGYCARACLLLLLQWPHTAPRCWGRNSSNMASGPHDIVSSADGSAVRYKVYPERKRKAKIKLCVRFDPDDPKADGARLGSIS